MRTVARALDDSNRYSWQLMMHGDKLTGLGAGIVLSMNEYCRNGELG